MRTLALALLAASALAACQQQAEPVAPAPAAEPAAPAPKTAEERRSELRTESAQRQIEAQMNAEVVPAE